MTMTEGVPPAPQLDPHNPGILVTAMIATLTERGLTVRAEKRPGHVMIKASQPAIVPPAETNGSDLDGTVAGIPGFSQDLVFTRDATRPTGRPVFAWSLLWATDFRGGGEADMERIADGEDVDRAADVMTRILQVHA